MRHGQGHSLSETQSAEPFFFTVPYCPSHSKKALPFATMAYSILKKVICLDDGEMKYHLLVWLAM